MYAKNIWLDADEAKKKAIFAFNEEYKQFLSYGKTERLVVKEAIEMARKKGFKDISEFESLKEGFCH